MSQPTGVTIPGAKEGFNGTLSVTGYGSRAVRVNKINYSIETHTEEGAAAHGKAFYPQWVQDTDFTIEIVHLDAAERDSFNGWVRGYMNRASGSPNASGGPLWRAMLVKVPARNFARQGIPTGSLDYGDSIGQSGKSYRTMLTLHGATGTVGQTDGSLFRAAKNQPKESAPFYPSTGQVSGAAKADEAIFDATAVYPGRVVHVNEGLF